MILKVLTIISAVLLIITGTEFFWLVSGHGNHAGLSQQSVSNAIAFFGFWMVISLFMTGLGIWILRARRKS